MQGLNFPSYKFRFKNSKKGIQIFDTLRKKFVPLLPEEWVRQHVVQYLIEVKNCSPGLMAVEREISLYGLKKRFDIVVYPPNEGIWLLVECKSPKVKITQRSFDQIARYNLAAKADFLMITNGLSHYYCKLDYREKKYVFLNDIPLFRS